MIPPFCNFINSISHNYELKDNNKRYFYFFITIPRKFNGANAPMNPRGMGNRRFSAK